MIKNGGGLFPFSEKFREEKKRMSGELYGIRIWHGGEQSYVQVGAVFPLWLVHVTLMWGRKYYQNLQTF